MKFRTGSFRIAVTAVALLTLSTLSLVSHAQDQGGPPPPGGPGSGRGFGGPGGRGGRIQPATAPIDVLASELMLTSPQVDKIKAIQSAYRKERDSMMPGRGGPGGGGQGGPGGGGPGGPPPDREAMQAMMQKMQALDKAASDKIAAVLTDDQKAALPGAIQMMEAFQSTGIPPQALDALKVTTAQKKKAIGISKEMQAAMQQAMQDQDREAMQAARAKAHDRILALLTDDQKAALDKFVKDHPGRPGGPGGRPGGPGRGPGGPGGPGGPRGGQGGDGPPPPPDGNGPPPPPDGDGPPPAN